MDDFSLFVDLIQSLKKKEDLEDFLIGITTHQERNSLLQRVAIIKQLQEGLPQAKIAADLGVGVATVTRGSKELQQGRFEALRGRL